MEGLNITELKKLARHYNLHTKIKNIQKLNKNELISELNKHITFHDDHYTVKQDEYDLHEALKPKKKDNKKQEEHTPEKTFKHGALYKKDDFKDEDEDKSYKPYKPKF